MAYIRYTPEEEIPASDRVADRDNILRISGIHPRTMRQHFEFYKELMYGSGPLSRVQREMIGVIVSVKNDCHY